MSYQIIYADPPWSYRDKCNAGQRGAEFKYPTMTDRELMALPVREWVADDACLFMWTTAPRIAEAFAVMTAWGFQYKTFAFVWIKTNKNGTPFFGMGNWTRANAEPCLLGVKGKPKRVSAAVSQVILSPRREHSRKPDIVRDRIVQLVGDLPRLEMFARQSSPGWDTWGNEVEKFDTDTKTNWGRDHPYPQSDVLGHQER